MKVLIVYDTKFGNTKKVAELIADGIKTIEKNVVDINHVKDFDLSKDEVYDLIVIGSPNHAGTYTGKVKKFINNLSNASVKGKSFAVFDTYQSKTIVNKLEKRIIERIPDMKRALAGLSIEVTGLKGPILETDLPKCEEFGKQLAA